MLYDGTKAKKSLVEQTENEYVMSKVFNQITSLRDEINLLRKENIKLKKHHRRSRKQLGGGSDDISFGILDELSNSLQSTQPISNTSSLLSRDTTQPNTSSLTQTSYNTSTSTSLRRRAATQPNKSSSSSSLHRRDRGRRENRLQSLTQPPSCAHPCHRRNRKGYHAESERRLKARKNRLNNQGRMGDIESDRDERKKKYRRGRVRSDNSRYEYKYSRSQPVVQPDFDTVTTYSNTNSNR